MRIALVLGAVVLVFASCGDDVQYMSPKERKSEPTRAASRLPPGHPPIGSGQLAPGGDNSERIDPHGSMGAHDPFADPHDSGKPVTSEGSRTVSPDQLLYSGRVELDPSFQLPASYAVFICAGLPDTRAPVASKKYDRPAFPFTFELRQDDLTFKDTPVDKPLALFLIFSERGYVMPESGVYFRTQPTEALPLESTDVVLTVSHP